MSIPLSKHPVFKEFRKLLLNNGIQYTMLSKQISCHGKGFPHLLITFDEKYITVLDIAKKNFSVSFPCCTINVFLLKLVKYKFLSNQNLLKIINQ